jgi:protein phosphatase 1 regulatory subunit 11
MAAAATSSRAPPPSGHLARSSMAATASQTQTQAPPLVQVRQPVLRLRGAETGVRNKKRIQWAEDVIDNEGLGRKSSKGNALSLSPRRKYSI